MRATTKRPRRIGMTDAEIREAIRFSREWDRKATKIVAAKYDRKRDMIVTDLSTGVILCVPRSAILGFAKAKPDALADLEIMPGQQTLWSATVDDGVLLEQLIVITAGEQLVGMLGARINASKTSEARATASRANGVKGGRPRKHISAK
jgi:hypothetical protein